MKITEKSPILKIFAFVLVGLIFLMNKTKKSFLCDISFFTERIWLNICKKKA